VDPIFESIDRYIRNLFVPEDDALIAVAQSIVDAGMPQISVSPIEGKLLHLLARLCGANRILEIGTLAPSLRNNSFFNSQRSAIQPSVGSISKTDRKSPKLQII
jgi:hypothetical protein